MSDQNHEDHELSTWRGEWQKLGGSDQFAAALVARAAQDAGRMRRAASLEILATTFSSSVCLWLTVRTHGAIEVTAMTALILLFNGAYLAHFFSARAGLFKASGEGIDGFVQLTRSRLAIERDWTRLTSRGTLALTGLSVPWGLWLFLAHRDAYLAEPWRAVVGFGGAVLILGCVHAWARIKARTLGAEAEAFERHLGEARID